MTIFLRILKTDALFLNDNMVIFPGDTPSLNYSNVSFGGNIPEEVLEKKPQSLPVSPPKARGLGEGLPVTNEDIRCEA